MKEKCRKGLRKYKKLCAVLLVIFMTLASVLPIQADELDTPSEYQNSTTEDTTEESTFEDTENEITSEELNGENTSESTLEENISEEDIIEENVTEEKVTEESVTEEVISENNETTEDSQLSESLEDEQNGQDELLDIEASVAASVEYDENGFGEDTDGVEIYQPAVLNTQGVYEISNAGQLYWFAAQVNAGNNSISGKLTQNIVINENVLTGVASNSTENFRTWTPIGKSSSTPFTASFDGNNYSISGIYIPYNSSNYYTGLFGYITVGTVKNLGIKDSYFKGTSFVGGIAGYIYSLSNDNDISIINCYNEGTVSGTTNYVGGIVGYIYKYGGSGGITISNCHNSGVVEGLNYVGGITGDIYKEKSDGSITISNCYNTGKVSGTNSYIAGIIGYFVSYNANGDITFDNCYNKGVITGKYQYTGGIVGYYYDYNTSSVENSLNISSCYNEGQISAQYYVGGLFGYADKYSLGNITIEDCENKNIISALYNVGGLAGYLRIVNYTNNIKISDCVNTGMIAATDNYSGGSGGIIGYLAVESKGSSIIVENCSNEGSITAKNMYIGGVIGYLYSHYSTSSSADAIELEVSSCSNSGAIENNYSSSYAGGIIGYINACSVDINNCKNNASITGTSYSKGGIAAYISADSDYTDNVVYNCENTGELSDDNNSSYIGGILGYVYNVNIENCNNLADIVSAGQDIGGIVAYYTALNADIYSVSDCNNEGNITGTGSYTYIGGISGYSRYVSISGCNNEGNITGISSSSNMGQCYIGGVSGYCAAITDCNNTGAISGTNYYGCIGGIAGQMDDTDVTLTGNYNTGDVSGTYTNNGYVGGVSAYIVGSNTVTIKECNNEGSVARTGEVNDTSEYNNSVGGITGYIRGTTLSFEDCSNSGKIGGTGIARGGIAGYVNATSLTINTCKNEGNFSGDYQYTGGIIAFVNSSNAVLETCNNSGDISIESSMSTYSGGIIGIMPYTATELQMNECYNSGEISDESVNAFITGGLIGLLSANSEISQCYNTGDVSGGSYVAGLAGVISNGDGTIIQSYNTGDISGKGYAGGLAGVNYYEITECYNTGDISLLEAVDTSVYIGGLVGTSTNTITKSYNQGEIKVEADTGCASIYAGGLIGVTSKKVNNCYNLGSISADAASDTADIYIGGITGVASYELVENSYNTGVISLTGAADDATAYLGGIMGVSSGSTNCYYSDSCGVAAGAGYTDSDNVDDIEAYTTEDFARGLICYLLNNEENVASNDGELIWYQNIDNGKTPDESPRFAGGVVYLHEDSDDLYSNYENHIAGEDILFTGDGEYEPNCIYDGLGHRECPICGNVQESNIKVAAAYDTHNYVSSVTKEATIDEEGILTYTCTRCGDTYNVSIPKLKEDDEKAQDAVVEEGTAETSEDTPSTTEASDEKSSTTKTNNTTTDKPSTGDASNPALFIFIGLLALAGCAVVSIKKIKENKE